jgi:hypothetical protein
MPSFFGKVNPLSQNGARARIEIRPALSGHRFLPLAIPDNVVTKVQVRYIDQCTNKEILTQDLAQLPSGDYAGYQSKGGGTLWAVPVPGSDPPVGDPDRPAASGLPMTAYDPGDCAGLAYRPIAEQVRLASAPDVDLNANSCTQLKDLPFADCFTRLSQIRIWDDGNPSADEALIKDVRLTGGCAGPGDAYFGVPPLGFTNCKYDVAVDVDWGSRDDGNLDVPANFTVSANSKPLNLVSTSGNTKTYASSGGLLSASVGSNDVKISLKWVDTDKNHKWNSQDCTNSPSNTPCKFSLDNQPVHRTVVGEDSDDTSTKGDPNATGAVESVHTSLAAIDSSGNLGPSFDNWHPSTAGGDPCKSPCSIYPTVGIRSALSAGTLTVLRTEGSQGTQLVDCDPAVSSPLTLFKYGCQPWFGANTFTDPNWWTTAAGCPDKNKWYSWSAPLPYTNSANNPWRCVLNQGGVKAGQAGDWMFVATDNCKLDNGTNCQTPKTDKDADVHCGNYDGKPAQGGRPADPNGWIKSGDSNDPRVVSLFVVPYQSLKDVGGSGKGAPIPVLRFASFYVMNWLGGPSGNEDDPCPDPDFNGTNVPVPADKAAIIGVFDTTVDFEPGPVDPNAICQEDDPTPCRAVLVR